MRHIIELSQHDICQIIAEKYSASIETVSLNTGTEYEGYGPMETPVTVITGRVILPNSRDEHKEGSK